MKNVYTIKKKWILIIYINQNLSLFVSDFTIVILLEVFFELVLLSKIDGFKFAFLLYLKEFDSSIIGLGINLATFKLYF